MQVVYCYSVLAIFKNMLRCNVCWLLFEAWDVLSFLSKLPLTTTEPQ